MKKVLVILLVLTIAFSFRLNAYATQEDEDVWWGECVRLTSIVTTEEGDM